MGCRFLNDPAAPFHSSVELFFFGFQDILNDREVCPELGVLGHIPYVHVHNFGERSPDVKVFHHAQRPSQDKACKVSCLNIGRNNSVSEHEGKAAGVVGDSIDLFYGLHYSRKLIDGHSYA